MYRRKACEMARKRKLAKSAAASGISGDWRQAAAHGMA
jgi:hypothetical protein